MTNKQAHLVWIVFDLVVLLFYSIVFYVDTGGCFACMLFNWLAHSDWFTLIACVIAFACVNGLLYLFMVFDV